MLLKRGVGFACVALMMLGAGGLVVAGIAGIALPHTLALTLLVLFLLVGGLVLYRPRR